MSTKSDVLSAVINCYRQKILAKFNTTTITEAVSVAAKYYWWSKVKGDCFPINWYYYTRDPDTGEWNDTPEVTSYDSYDESIKNAIGGNPIYRYGVRYQLVGGPLQRVSSLVQDASGNTVISINYTAVWYLSEARWLGSGNYDMGWGSGVGGWDIPVPAQHIRSIECHSGPQADLSPLPSGSASYGYLGCGEWKVTADEMDQVRYVNDAWTATVDKTGLEKRSTSTIEEPPAQGGDELYSL